MRPSSRLHTSKLRPLSFSLARLSSAAAITAALLAAGQSANAQTFWYGAAPDGLGGDLPGDGFLWTNPLNWFGDIVPPPTDALVFADPGAAVGTILLCGNQTADSIRFTVNETLGAYGERNLLTVTSGNVVVDAGVRAVINADFAGTNALNLSGGGSLLLNNFVNSFTGPINIDGGGTSLTFRGQGVLPYINNNTHVIVGRSDAYSLGFTNKVITLSNGGELRLVGTGYNPDSTVKNMVLGAGGGAINLPAGWQQFNIDDPSQITGPGGLTKNGNGRLFITGTQDYLLGGLGNDHVLNSGVLQFNRLLAGGASGTRFAAFNAASTITVNGGLLVPDANVGVVDNNLTLNGGALGTQSGDNEYGLRTGAVTTLTLNGGSILSRDAFNPLQIRSPRINSVLSGSGTINLYGAKNAAGIGGQGHVVFQRSDVDQTLFTGTFVLRDYATIENRANQGATANVGKTISNATLEMAGINTLLDMRDNGTGNNLTLSQYTSNNINVTGTQAGSLYRIGVIRSTANTGNTFHFGTLGIGNQRLQVTGADGYALRLSGLTLTGSPTFDLISANTQIDGTVNESGLGGQGITKHLGNSNLTFTGAVNVRSVDVRHGNVILSGATGAINPGMISGMGAITVNGTALVSTFTGGAGTGQLNGGALLLDNTVGTNADRLGNAVPITMIGSSTLRLTSQSGTNVSELTGNVSVPFGNPTFDVVRTGGAELPVLTLGTAALSRGANSVLNFTGTGLGTGATASQIILNTPLTPFLGGWATSGNEFAKYDAFGVTPLVAANYAPVAVAGDLVSGANGKVGVAGNPLAVAPITLAADAAINSLNFQTTVAASTTLTNVNTNGFTLTVESGGILGSGSSTLITGTAAGGLTAGTTAAPAQLFVTTNGTTYNMWVNSQITDNLAGGAVTLVKSGTGILSLPNRGTPASVGAPGYTNTFTGGVVVNNGILTTTRGTYLGASTNPITLAGGQLEVNMPSLTVHGVLPGFGHNITVTANSFLAADDNGVNGAGGQEASDATAADNNLIPWGSLTINGGHTLSITAFGQYDQSFTSSSFTGVPTINTATGRDSLSHVVMGGAMTGSGFNLIANGTNPGSLILGAGAGDTTANGGLSSPITVFGTTLRLNKANDASIVGGFAVGDLGAGEDIIINGGTLAWGPGHVGNIAADNSNQQGIANLSPAAIRLAGQDQIADTATITLLSGTIGETDRIQNDVVGRLNMFSGTLNSGNSGEGKLEFVEGNISGGTVNFNFATHLKFGTLNLLPGAPALGVANGFIARKTTLEIGAGGLNFNGSRIELQSGGLSNFAGGGAVLRLGGNVTASPDPLNGTSLAGQGIFATVAANMREFSNSYIDLAGDLLTGPRDFNIADGIVFGVSALMTNGGFSKSGTGIMDVQQYAPKVFDTGLFDGPVAVNGGILIIRNNQSLGTALGGVTVNAGGTLKVDGSIVSGDNFTITGAGANVTGTTDVQELGALVVDQGQLTVNGTVALGGNATITSSVVATTGVAAAPIERALLVLANPAGISSTGPATLTLSGNGDGLIVGGINTVAGGLNKSGSGRWEIGGAGTYTGLTVVTVGALRIGNGTALGSTGAGTAVYHGASLELTGGISVAEPLLIGGDGAGGVQSGALVNVGGNNTYSGPITLLGTTIRSSAGTLDIAGPITGGATSLVLDGPGNGSLGGIVTIGPAPSGDVLTKNGTGIWTLSANNALNGSTAVNGGTLVLASPGLALSAAHALNLGGGSVAVTGGGQAVDGLNLLAGGGTVNGGVNLAVGVIARSTGASVNFAGTVTTSNPNTNGILGGYATFGSDWARENAGTIEALPAASYLDISVPVPVGTAADNAATALMLPSGIPGAPVALNSLKIGGGSGVNVGGGALPLTSGGIIYSSNLKGGIAGAGILSGFMGTDDLIVHVTGAALDITSPIIGGLGGLVKAGPGKLTLSADNNAAAWGGSIAINGGTLSIVGAGGSSSNALGTAALRTMTFNGGTLEVAGGDYDPSPLASMQFVIGSAGGTLRSACGANISVNDGPGQLTGSGDLTLTGGGRFIFSGGTPSFPNYTGAVTLDQGVLTVGSLTSLGGRANQTLTLAPGTAFINNAGGAGNALGLPNNIVANGTSIFSLDATRTFAGDIQFSGTNTIGLIERDTVSDAQSVVLNGRVSGSGTINVFGTNQGAALGAQANGSFVFLGNSSNTFTGTYNLKTNAGLEARQPGSLGSVPGGVTVTMDTNSRLLLRGPASGDFAADVIVNGDATINADRMAVGASFGSGDRTQFAINNLEVRNGKFLGTLTGGNNYAIRVNGSATFTGNANLLLESNNLALVNGATFTGGSQALHKYGGFGLFLFDASNHTGTTVINNGAIHLRGNAGALSGTGRIELRGPGATLFVDNGDGVNANRISDTADLVLGGGALRVYGIETLLANNVTAPGGHTTVSYNNASLTTSTALQLGTNPFVRSIGATLNFTSDNGTLGVANAGQFRAQPRITIPGQADVLVIANVGDIIPWAVGTNNEFVRYDGTTIEGGAPLGVIQVNNNAFSNYLNDPAINAASGATIARTTGVNSTTIIGAAVSTIRAIKMDGGAPPLNQTSRRIDLAAQTLIVDRGLVNHIAQTQNIGNANTTTPGTLTTGNPTGELFLMAQGGTLDIGPGSYTAAASTTTSGTAVPLGGSVIIANNGITPLVLVKSGAGTVELRNTAAGSGNTFTGGVFVNQGTLRTFRGNGLGPASNTLTLNGGLLEIHSDETPGPNEPIAGLGHNVVVNGNAVLGADNGPTGGATNVDDNLVMGTLTVNGPYIFGVGAFDGFDFSFTDAAFTGTPIIDIGIGRASATADLSTTTINGIVSGSGFRVIAGNVTASTIGTLELAGAAANSYSGEVTVYDGTVRLNKSVSDGAITGDLTVNGGTAFWVASNQMSDAGDLTLNRGTVNLNGTTETINNLNMNGGLVTTGAGNLTILGNATLRGASNADGLQINSTATVTVGGTLRILDFGKATIGGAGASITTLSVGVGGLQMEGSTIRINADASTNGGQLILLGNVETLASAVTAGIGNVDGVAGDDAETFINLNGTRTFKIANGGAGNDLLIRGVIRNNGVNVGGLVKTDEGAILLQGGGNANTYSGPTAVNDGALVLHKIPGVAALGNGAATNTLTIGDGAGAAMSAAVIVRNSEQIANTTDVTIDSDGLLDLGKFNTSESIGNLSGAIGSAIDLGPTSTLTVNSTVSTDYSGSIGGGGTLNKEGAGLLWLRGDSELNVWNINVNAGTLNVDSDVNNAAVTVTSTAAIGAQFGVSQLMTSLTIGSGSTVVLGDLPGPPPSPFGDGGLDGDGLGADFGGASAPVQGVPEPGTATLLVGGLLTMLGLRRRRG